MKNYSYSPTEENVLSLLKSDPIQRRNDVFRFVDLLSHMENDCYSVALNGAWGSGKTFFVKQVKLILDTMNMQSSLSSQTRETVEQVLPEKHNFSASYSTLYYDAWEYDNHEDPMLSLIYAAIETHQHRFDTIQIPNIITCAAKIMDIITNRNVSSIIKELQGKDSLSSIYEQEDLRALTKSFIDSLIPKYGDRLVIFIDELDRCKPDYAVRLLERIKHYFDDNRITFVFSVNMHQLQHTVKSFYGSEFNATRYLDKFFDLRISLPDVSYDLFLESQVSLDNYTVDAVCSETVKYFRFSLRETERYIRLTKIARKIAIAPTSSFYEDKAISFSANYIVPIMIGLQMYDIDMYHRFISGDDSGPLLEILLNPNVNLVTRFLVSRDETSDDIANIITGPDGATTPYKDRIKAAYNALFCKSHPLTERTTIGRMIFSDKTRLQVERIASLLHPQSDYEFD